MALLVGLMLALIPAVVSGAEAAAGLSRLGLLVEASTSTPDPVLEAFREETERVLPIPGLEIQWRRAGSQTGTESFDRLIVVRLVGECLPHQEPAPSDAGPLGVTHLADGRILPFVEADCARIVRAAQRLRRHPFRLRAEELGRALGRVIAHEVYHVLSASRDHDDKGLSKCSLSAVDLFLPGIAFDRAALDRMAAGLPRRTQQAAVLPEVSNSR